MGVPVIGTILEAGSKLIDKVVPDAADRQAAKLELAKMAQDGEFREQENQLKAITIEAQSKDPWTSRARPTFLYVMYVFILLAIPFGILGVWYPEEVKSASAGMKAYLESLPRELYVLFGAGYLGYVKKRSDDKKAIITGSAEASWLSRLF